MFDGKCSLIGDRRWHCGSELGALLCLSGVSEQRKWFSNLCFFEGSVLSTLLVERSVLIFGCADAVLVERVVGLGPN